jgi:hypothetical protein
MLTIHREIEKKEYEKSVLGQLEKRIRNFYDEMILKKKQMPEDLAKEIYDIRDSQEKRYMEYIDMRNVEDRKAIDSMLEDAFNKELAVIDKYYDRQKNG